MSPETFAVGNRACPGKSPLVFDLHARGNGSGLRFLFGVGGARKEVAVRRYLVLSLVLLAVAGGCDSSESESADRGPETTFTDDTGTTTPPGVEDEIPPESPAGETTTSTATTPNTAGAVAVTRDLAYRSDDSRPHLLDVYAPTGTGGGPLVVFLHGGSVDKSYPIYPPVASLIAERGAVVFAPSWGAGRPSGPDDVLRVHDEVACAISFALAHAPGYGADPDILVLVGHSAGASAASMAGLREPNPITDCAVEMTPFQADGMVLWDGDWIMGDPFNDGRNDMVGQMEVAQPWSWLADGPRMPITLITAAGARNELKRCGLSDPDGPFWVRDPDGWFREQLDAMDALEGGCLDLWEPTAVLANTMREHGYDVNELILEHSFHEEFDTDDLTILVDEIIAITDR
jgi:pimeloyl-ACP methyl ester carboxylesterase